MDGVVIYSVLTLKEASDMWGLTPLAIQFKLMRAENKEPDRVLLRKSGGTWLTTLEAMRYVYGEPAHARKDYE